MKKVWLLIILSLYLLDSASQSNLGMPDIINYSKYSYSAGTQNWGIVQDKNGIIYFANNEGLLSFDGTNWKIFPLPNKTIVRSVAIGPDGKIYVGGQDEMGYFSPDKRGKLIYHSLLPLISKNDLSFADVWNIIIYNKSIFFRSARRILEYNSNKIISYPGSEWRFLGKSNGLLLAQDSEKGLLTYRNGFWEPFDVNKIIPDKILATSLITINNETSLLTTLKEGCYRIKDNKIIKWNTPAINLIAEKQIYFLTIVETSIVFGTTLNGCYIVDLDGNEKSHFSRSEGLQNNNILSAYSDRDKNLWLGLNNGIDFISYNNAIKHIYPDVAKDASGYTSIIYNNDLYLGTSNGLYKTPLNKSADISFGKSQFEVIANTGGQVWNLSQVNGNLLLGHHEGSFIIKNNKAVPIDKSSGFWTFLPYTNVLPSSIMIAGTYQGIRYYNYNNKNFTSLKNAAFESARFVTVDGSDIWVSHPYKGIFKIIKNKEQQPEVLAYGSDKGIASINGNFLFKLKNDIIVTSEKGILQYNSATDNFEPSSYYNKIFENIVGIRYLKEDNQGNIWFVFQKRLGLVDMSGNRPTIIYIPEVNNKILSGFEHVYPIDANNIIVGAEKGYYHINYKKYKQNTPEITAGIRSVSAYNKKDSILFGGYINDLTEEPLPSISYNWNTFHFEYSSTLFGQQSNIEYSYLLDGFDKTWSEWTKKTSKEYTNVPAGTYTFKVKARNNLGNESVPSVFSFKVLPPWYQTSWAIGAYILFIGIGVYFFLYYQRKKFHQQRLRHIEEQKKLQYLHQLELDQNEKQIIKLKNEKLESEIQFKNKELATVAMHLVQKGELLTSIKDEMVKLKNHPENGKSPDNFKKIIKIINEEERMDEDWEHFALHFDKVHSDFLLALKDRYPNLSANELKLSAYLRMNLSSKEIAQLMNISVRGVEIGRYRLRKKLQISTETNLFHFLLNFKANKVLENASLLE